MDPRLSVSQASSWSWSIDEDLAFYEAAGIDRVGLSMHKLSTLSDAAISELKTRLDDAGIAVSSLLQVGPFSLHDADRWPEQKQVIGRFMDVAMVLRPQVCVVTTGTSGGLSWEMAADAFHDVMTGTINEAEREGLFLCLEHTTPLRADVSFVHTLRDALELGWRLDMGVCMEINACWGERNLAGTVESNVVAIGLVQVSDAQLGTRTTPDRLVPGDGELPLKRIVRHLMTIGYAGHYELELVGPAIEQEGYEKAISRAIEAMEGLFEEIEAEARAAEQAADDDEEESGDAGAADDPATDLSVPVTRAPDG